MTDKLKNVIEINELTIYYQQVCALSKVNIHVKEKEFLGIIGPNGGGKSTLLKAILGLIKPHSGRVRIMGKPPSKAPGIMGYVPQFTRFYGDFPIDIEGVILMGRLPSKTPIFHKYSKEDREITHSLMDKLDLYPLRKRQIGKLSGGQLQRTLIARALAMDPKILILDEPTASLDAESKSHIYSILHQLNKDMTIIMVTHDMSAISSQVTTLACLNRELYYHGHPEVTEDILHKLHGCPIDLIAHGVPHRVLKEHDDRKEDNYLV